MFRCDHYCECLILLGQKNTPTFLLGVAVGWVDTRAEGPRRGVGIVFCLYSTWSSCNVFITPWSLSSRELHVSGRRGNFFVRFVPLDLMA